MPESQAREWLAHEDHVAFEQRVGRLEWLAANYPENDAGFLLSGGWLAHELLEEARYSFAYGQFLAAAILGVAFVERTLAARFYAAGRDDLERASGVDLLRQALAQGWVSAEEFRQLDNIRQMRNPIAHFRRSGSPDTPEYRAVQDDIDPFQVVESDARAVLEAVFGTLRNSAV